MVINPLKKAKLLNFFNKNSQNVLRYFIFKAIYSQPEILPNQKPLPIHVPKEHIEQWLVQCLGADPVGSGSYPVDIIHKKSKFGADAKMLSWDGKQNSLSGETSMGQNFKDIGNNLDSAFSSKNFSTIISDWSKLLIHKYDKVFSEYTFVKNIYYFFIIREQNNFHIFGMRVDTKSLGKMAEKRHTDNSVWIENMIDSKYGEVRIYKAKKRMELRLYPYQWIKENIKISFYNENLSPQQKHLLSLTEKQLFEHSKSNYFLLSNDLLISPKKK